MKKSRKGSPIELIAIDLDGTLLNSNGIMTLAVETTIKRAMNQGIGIVLATGKTRFAARDVIDRLGLGTPGIYVQGTVIHNSDGTIRYQQELPVDVARRVIAFAEENGLTLLVFSGTRLLTCERNRYTDRFLDYAEPVPESVGPLQAVLGTVPINKLLFVGAPLETNVIRVRLSSVIGSEAAVVQAVSDSLEVLPLGASKGAAVKKLLSDLRVPSDRLLAIGDADNDVELLQLAGVAVAVGNATPGAKAVAHRVVASNDADGVAEAIERFAVDRI